MNYRLRPINFAGLLAAGLLAACLLALPGVCSAADDRLTPPGASVDFARLAPPETAFFVQVRDLEELKKNWLKTALGKHFQDKEVLQQSALVRMLFLDYIDRYLNAFSIDHEIVDKLFEHQVALYINDLSPLGSSYSYEVCLMVERGDKKKEEFQPFIDKMMADFPERAQRNVLKVEGVDIYQVKFQQEILFINNVAYDEKALAEIPEEVKKNLEIKRVPLERNAQYAYVDDLFLICDGNDLTLTRTIKQLKNAGQAGLDTQESYRRVTRRLQQTAGASGPPAARIWMNFGTYYEYLSEKAKALKQDEAPLKRLGFDTIQGLGAALYLDGADVTLVGAAQCSSLRQGLPSLLPLLGANQLAAARLVPAEAISFNGLAFDARGLYRKIFELIEPAAAENAKLIQQQLLPDIDLEGDLLGALGREVALFFPKPDGAGQGMEATYVLEVADEQKIKSLIQTFIQNSGAQGAAIKTESLAYKGYTINSIGPTMEAAPAAPKLHWVFADRHLIAGAELETIKQSIDVMRGERESFLSSSQLRRARQLLPDKCDYLEVINLARRWPLGGSFSFQLIENFLGIPLLPRLNPNSGQEGLQHELELLLIGGKVRDNGLDLKILAKGRDN